LDNVILEIYTSHSLLADTPICEEKNRKDHFCLLFNLCGCRSRRSHWLAASCVSGGCLDPKNPVSQAD